MKFAYGLDIETHDPLLKTSGYSWKYGRGYILNTAVYDATHDSVIVLAGIHNENCPYKEAQRREQNEVVKKILTNPDAIVVGANIIYDLGWLLYEYGMEGSDVKCSLVDVLQAEHILDEFTTCSLESVSRKYLHYGKSKDGAERWVREHLHGAGDFRRHLNAVPWDLLCEYVSGDAKNPVKVWLKQVALLREQNLLERAKLEFNCILPTLQLTALGMPIDAKQKRANLDTLDEAICALEREFKERYGMPNFRVTASADIAKFCDMRGIPYNHKITLTGERGERFSTDARMRAACQRARRLVSSMHIEKNRAVAYVPKELAERTGLLLADAGFDFNSSPNVDKNFFAGSREAHPEIDLIANWKLALGLKSKILGKKFDQFITKNAEGLDCVRSQYPITSTVTFRFCSEKPNCITGDSKLLTPNGYVPLSQLKVGSEVYDGNGNLTSIRNIWYKGKRECLCLVSANGSELVCTPDHRLWSKNKWTEARKLYEADIIERRTDCIPVQGDVDYTADYRGAGSRQGNCKAHTAKTTATGRVKGVENEAQATYSRGVYKSRDCFAVCKRVYITIATQIQRFMHKVQGIYEQREKLPREVSNQRGASRATQSTCSTGKVSFERNVWQAPSHLQRGVSNQSRLHHLILKGVRLLQKRVHSPSSLCGSIGYSGCKFTKNLVRTSHRPQPLEQRLGQLDSMYAIRTQPVTQATCGVREVYDIEVEAENHSFIANGFRVKNCQQVPSKGGFTARGVEYSFPKLTRSLFTAAPGCVFGKIDYGQIEYRLICNIAVGAEGERVRAMYMTNPHIDFHQMTMDFTGLVRKLVKNLSFGTAFGMSIESMAKMFGWSLEHAKEIYATYNEKMPFVKPTLEAVGLVAQKRGYIITALGSHARLQDKSRAYTMLNRYTQGSGAECFKAAMVRAFQEGVWQKIKAANIVHDELNAPYLRPKAEDMLAFYRMAEIMRTAVPSLKVPLEAEIELGDNWADTREVKDWISEREAGSEAWARASYPLKSSVAICERLIKEGRVQSA